MGSKVITKNNVIFTNTTVSRFSIDLAIKLMKSVYGDSIVENLQSLSVLMQKEFDMDITYDDLISHFGLGIEIEDRELQIKHLEISY